MGERFARFTPAAAVTLFAVAAGVASERSAPVAAITTVALVGYCFGIAAISPQGWRLAGLLLIAVGGFVVLGSANPASIGWFGVCVLTGWCAFYTKVAPTAALAATLIVVLIGEWIVESTDAGWAAWMAGVVFTGFACQLARRQRELLVELRAAQAGLADRTRIAERNRIAHELHDVIGHALTVSLLHVSSARLALQDGDPDEAEASLAEAERLARHSLHEVRASVGMLRVDDVGGAAPLPGVAELPELVNSFQRAATPVSYEVAGDLSGLTSTAGLTIYRVLQEALTNVTRHAPGSSASALVERTPDSVRVTIDSDGPPGRGQNGVGLIGMRERVEALGGRLYAGPFEQGWRVEAVLPV